MKANTWLVTITVVYTAEIEAKSEAEAYQIAQKIELDDTTISEQRIEVEQ